MKQSKASPTGTLNQSILHLLHRAGQRTDELFASTTDKLGITARQYVVLAAIAANPDCSQTDIVNATGIDRSTIAEMIKRLEVRKLIRRKRSKEDNRAYVVSLTAEGTKTLAAAEPWAKNVDAAVGEAIGAKRQADLIKTLNQIVDAVEVKK